MMADHERCALKYTSPLIVKILYYGSLGNRHCLAASIRGHLLFAQTIHSFVMFHNLLLSSVLQMYYLAFEQCYNDLCRS
jgi:hypothetical protein